MWSSVASAVPAAVTPAHAVEDETPESAADLQAALLRCLGEEDNKILRGLCGKLVRGACSADDFHAQGLALFQRAGGGSGAKTLGLYRRLVLSLPHGDKRALLVSLVDEAVATAAKPAEAPPVASITPPPPKGAGAAEGTGAVALAAAAAGPSTAKPSAAAAASGDDSAAEEPADAAHVLDSTRKASASKEKAILTVMARRQADLAKEKRALDMIRVEMAAVSQQQNKEILDVMTSLGETDKDLYYLERDFKAAEAEYLKCKARCVEGSESAGARRAWGWHSVLAAQRLREKPGLELGASARCCSTGVGRYVSQLVLVRRYDKMRAAKAELAGSLTSLTLNAEKCKEERLNSIMEKLKADGVVFPGAALASLTEE